MATSPAVSFKESCIPELSYVTVYLHDNVAGILTYFDNILGRLEKLTINGSVYVDNNGDQPRLADLRQWLTMSTSSKFTFEMNLTLPNSDDEHMKTLLAEYRRVTGNAQSKYYQTVNIVHPKMSLVHPVECNDEDSSDESMDEGVNYVIDIRIFEVRRRRRISILHIINCFDVHSSTLSARIV